MTRTTRANSNPHAIAAAIAEYVPRLWGKASMNGDQPPYKAKKNGAGRGNWGREGDELADVEEDYNFNPQIQRRRSNSNGGNGVIRRPSWDTKFNEVEEEVFDEEEE
ncbi:hypothetical protein V1520DRAFT_340918 [Lipomyces starkeyi]|uniref:Hyaluronan/mRNA-binding protein domain-containing protein n=1 Tax=Lipomyces starkeyi NRRL Y-11557 TaxID=675824 RepID=A0A1E3Q558_LIPST|nr:hypothetical protein LIPSTDRAFT_28325 [Lipomyces starkeyi NRRL Y-11557]